MKKSFKFLTFTAIIAVVMIFTLTGCSSAPFEAYLNTNWDTSKKEVATYDYTFKKGDTNITGELVTTIYDAKGKTFSIGSQQFENVDKGTYYEYRLETNNNGFTDVIFSQVYFKGYAGQNHRPIASYTERTTVDGTVKTELSYNAKSCTAKVTDLDGNVSTFKTDDAKGLTYDNAQLYAMSRTFDFAQKGSLQFKTPVFERNNIYPKHVAMGMISQGKFNTKNEDGTYVEDKFTHINAGNEFGFALVLIQNNDKPAGLPQQILVAINAVTINGVSFDQPVLQITEGNEEKGLSTYVLKDMKKVDF